MVVLVYQDYWENMLISFLKHGDHENPTVISANYQTWVIVGSVDYRFSDWFIWKEKLELVFVVEILDDQGVEVNWAIVYLVGEWGYVIDEQRQFYALIWSDFLLVV